MRRVVSAASGTAWLSWMRVAAITAVVTVHVVGSTATAPDARDQPLGLLAVGLDMAGIAAVPVFVMLSGVLLLDPERYRGAPGFWRRRAVRLLPAVVVWHLAYLVLRQVRGDGLGPGEALQLVVTGRLYPHLYFFWIVLGLAVLTPLLMPVVRRIGRRGTAALGVAGMIATAAAAALGAPTALVHTAATWWIPYLGAYLLGWGVREIRAHGAALAAVATATVALWLLLSWQWRNPAAPELLDRIAPVSYYGAGVGLYAVGVLLLGRALLAPDGVLRVTTAPRAAALGRRLGDATLGVFGLHLLVLAGLDAVGLLGGDDPATSAAQLLARVLVVLLVSYGLVLLLRRVPVVRAVM